MSIFSIVLCFFFLLRFGRTQTEQCQGKSDVVFVIDYSWSVSDHSWNIFMQSCISIVSELDNVNEDGVHISIVEFGSNAYTDVALTGDKDAVIDHFKYRADGCDAAQTGDRLVCNNRRYGCTYSAHGLKEAYDELKRNGRDNVQKIVFFLTDGRPFYYPEDNCAVKVEDGIDRYNEPDAQNKNCCDFMATELGYDINQCQLNPGDTSDRRQFDSYCETAIEEFSKRYLIDELSALVVPIRIGTGGWYSMMLNMATYDCLYHRISSFDEDKFNELIGTFKTLTCFDAYRIDPTFSCSVNSETNVDLSIIGTGYFNTIPKASDCSYNSQYCYETCSGLELKCKYTELESGKVTIEDATLVDENNLICPIKLYPETEIQQISVQVSLDGNSYTTESNTFAVVNCTEGYKEETEDGNCECKGVTDIVFVLDSSYSVSDTEFSSLRDFMDTLLSSICIHQNYTHVSIVQFTTTEDEGYAHLEFSLTGDSNEVLRRARNLGRFGKGGTPLHSGLKLAYEEILNNGRNEAYKFVVVITDGVSDSCRGINVDQGCIDPTIEQNKCTDQYSTCYETTKDKTCYWDIMASDNYQLTCCNCDEDWLDKIEGTGAFIFGVAVGDSLNPNDDLDEKYVKEVISSKTSYYAHANDYNAISTIIGQIVEATCIDVYYTDPGSLCFGDDIDINIIGHGFSKDTTTFVRFYHAHDSEFVDYEATYLNSKRLNLKIIMDTSNSPHFKVPAVYQYQVSVGGKFWSDLKEFTYNYESAACQTQIDIVPIVAGVTLFILLVLLLAAILLLISLFMCGIKRKPVVAKAVELKEEELEEPAPLPEILQEEEPEPEPYVPPPKIKRSMYFVGGKAMSVDWGEKGMTWDSPFRGANMGMGDNYGHNKKNKLYEEIQRRKKERLKNKNLIEQKKNIGEKPAINRKAKPKLSK